MASIARPVFEAGPSDQIKEVDVYNITDTQTRNALTSKLSTFGDGLSGVYGKSTQVLSGIKNRLLSGNIDVYQASERIERALKGSRSDITSLSTDLQNVIFEEVTGKAPGTNYVKKASDLINTVKIVTERGDRVFNNTNYGQVNAVMRFVSDLTGNSIFKSLDLGAEAALLKGVLTEVSQWGIPELIDDILDKTDKEVSRTAVRRSASAIASAGDIDSIESMINKLGASTLTSQTPNFASTLISRYRFKPGTTAADYPALLTQLVSVMDKLQPNWFFTNRNYLSDETQREVSEDIANLSVLAVASDDAVTLLSSSDEYLKYVVTAPLYPSKKAKTLLKTMYPYIAIA